jgi:hypothetical protein
LTRARRCRLPFTRRVAIGTLATRVHPGVAGYIRRRPDDLFMVDEFTVPAFRRRGITPSPPRPPRASPAWA